jgi:hypothetical protein
MKFLLSLFFLLPFSLEATTPFLPVHHIEAEQVSFDEQSVRLKTNVRVVHEIGILTCQESRLTLDQHAKQEGFAVRKIFLQKDVTIKFTDGSSLSCDEGEIDCETFETVFRAYPPKKVIYSTFTGMEKEALPIKATSRVLRATIVKTEQGHALKSLKGEGAVNIEYLKNEGVPA